MLTKTGQSNQQLPAQILGGIGEALILIYSVNILFSIFPLKLSDPIWQSQVATLLRSTSLFLLIGIALIFVCEYLNKSIKLFYFPSRRIQPLAVFAAIGFLLLIPVQCSSVYIQIRNSDNQANLEIRQADRRISAFRAVPNLNQLRDMAKDIPPGWQYDGSVSFEDNRSRLISTSEDQLARLRIMASSGKSQAVQKAVPDLISQAIICLLYAQVFYKMRPIKKRLVFDIDTDDVKDSELFP